MNMGFFSKIKNIFNKQEEIKEKINDEEIDNGESLDEIEEVKETEKYVEGLSKSRDNFVSKLSLLGECKVLFFLYDGICVFKSLSNSFSNI